MHVAQARISVMRRKTALAHGGCSPVRHSRPTRQRDNMASLSPGDNSALMSWVQPEIIWSYGVTGCTMDSESSDRGSNPRRTSLPLAMSRQTRRGQRSYPINLAVSASVGMTVDMGNAETRDRTGDLQIFSLTLSQLSYRV